MQNTLISLAIVGAAQAAVLTQDDFDFMQFVSKYGKSYGTIEEFNFRLENFKKTAAHIKEINASQNTHKAAHNKFSDYTEAEYKKLLGLKDMPKPNIEHLQMHDVNQNTSVANNIDWRNNGVVQGVKDQGSCGSCWAFSTTGSVESARAIAGYGLSSFSEQQLVDCSRNYGNNGCSGGWYYWAWTYLESYSLETESNYSYRGVDGGCSWNPSLGVATTRGQVAVPGDTNSIKNALNGRPVSVAIQADTYTFQTYSSGIITSSACGTNIDHAVLAVGYGDNYYIVKNSWGTWWGDQGYVLIGTGSGAGICGINQYVAYPLV